MNITYVLPPNLDTPSGGYKVVYQYSNELVARGHSVNIVFLKHVCPTLKKVSLQNAKNIINQLASRAVKNIKEISWFPIDKRIKLYFDVEYIRDFPDADVIIATAAPTTYIKNLPSSKGKKFYFIQGYETWWYRTHKEQQLADTFKTPNMTNIAISHELEARVNNITNEVTMYLPNFYNPSEFYLQRQLSPRQNVVALLNHSQESKRTKLGIEILKAVHEYVPDLKVELFGIPEAPLNLPDYFHVTKMANSEQLRSTIYGSAKLYLFPSVSEGWGLTGMEAMASGAALVASRIGGIVDYANDANSILIKADDKKNFIEAIIDLLHDDQKRQRIAKKGYEDVQQYHIRNSVTSLESILKAK